MDLQLSPRDHASVSAMVLAPKGHAVGEPAIERNFAKGFECRRSFGLQAKSVKILGEIHHPAFGDSTSVE